LQIDKTAEWSVTIVAYVDLAAEVHAIFELCTRHLPGTAGRLATADTALHAIGQTPRPPLISVTSTAGELLPWRLELTRPQALALARHEDERLSRTLVLVLVDIVLIAAIWFGIQLTVLRPLRHIEGRIVKFEAAQSQPAALQGDDAIARLDRALDRALSGWQRSAMALQTLNRTLEERVAERSAELQASEERYQLAIRGTTDAIYDWNLVHDTVFFSPRWSELLGTFASDSPAGWFDHVHADDRATVTSAIQQHLAAPSEPFHVEHRIRRADGSLRWVLARGQAVLDPTGKAIRLAGSLSDISSRKQAEAELLERAIHDPLTGLFTRQHLLEQLEQAIETAQRYRYALALCMCDIDHFKQVNDTNGHRMGDEVLAAFGAIIRNELRTSDFAGRYGGDELCLVFPHTRAVDAGISIERIRTALAQQPFGAGGSMPLHVTASFGIAELPADPCCAADLMGLADDALYEAKRAGRNCWKAFITTVSER
jgi:diguanylate cyclase (GGDEF)-like protein/PAS domain S-box-containing protein